MNDMKTPPRDGHDEAVRVAEGDGEGDGAVPLSAWAAPATLLSLAACGGSDAPALPAAFDRPDQARRSTLLATPTERPQATALPSADALMNWAQQVYPDFFPGTPATVSLPPYLYRHYERSGNYLGVADGRVYVLGPVSGGQLLDVGSLADFAPLVATDYRVAKPASDEEAARFLLQAQFSATRAEIARVRSLGYAGWLDEQMKAPRSISAWDWLDSRGYTKIDDHGYYGDGFQVMFALWYQLIVVPDAMRQRMALALSEFFVSTLGGVSSPWRCWVSCDFWDQLVGHAFGNFRTLLSVVSTHSAIGQLLSVLGSQKADPKTGRQPDENFARELMQLYTIGLYELNTDGSERLDAQGRPIETYHQGDVTQLARVFTGYDLATVPLLRITEAGQPLEYPDISQARLPLQCYADFHDFGEVRFLGNVIPANLPPERQRELALDTLFRHANVGPFFCRQMIQRLVTSNPSPGYVERVATVFNDNGRGVRGDLAAVFRAILLDLEARSVGGLQSSTFGKLREPMVRLAQFGRSFGFKSTSGSWKFFGGAQVPMGSVSVFGFFRPSHRLPGARSSGQALLAPEFAMVNEVSVADWTNLMRGLTGAGAFVPAPDVPAYHFSRFDGRIVQTAAAGFDLRCSYEDELTLTSDPAALVKHLNLVLAAGQLSPDTCGAIAEGLRANFGGGLTSSHPMELRVQMLSWAITTVMSIPQYLIQK